MLNSTVTTPVPAAPAPGRGHPAPAPLPTLTPDVRPPAPANWSPQVTITTPNIAAKPQNAGETADKPGNEGLRGVWKGLGNPLAWLPEVNDPASLRAALRLSQRDFAKLLSCYAAGRPNRPYQKHTVASFEFAYRHAARHQVRAKYRLSAETLAAYRALVEDVVAISGSGHYTVRARMGTRVWRFTAVTTCRTCGRQYTPATVRSVNCPRCCSRTKKQGGQR